MSRPGRVRSAGVRPAGVPLLFLAAVACGQSLPEREFGEPWNGVGFGARPLGMGGAYTALAEDLAGLYYNPGGLVRMRDTQLGVMTGTPYWKRQPEAGDFIRTVPFSGGLGMVTTIFKPWAAGLSVVRNFHSESILPWQENYYMGTFVMPLNKARTSGLGVNVKYLRSDFFYTQERDPVLQDKAPDWATLDRVTGWAVDAGMIYGIPMPVRDRRRELSIGVMARNVVGRSRILNTEKSLPSQALLGLAFGFDDLVPRERSVVALNLDQALRASAGGTSSQLRVGFEQWFFRHRSALRMGFATPFPAYEPVQEVYADTLTGKVGLLSQGRPVYTVGLTTLLFDWQVDLAATIPAEQLSSDFRAGLPETPIMIEKDASNNEFWLPADRARFYLQVTYHWPSPPAAPYAKIAVEPVVFTPKRGEVAVFTMDYRDERGVEAWEVEIKNSARVPVRNFVGEGAPPRRLVWDGLDNRFNLTPDDDHAYTVKVRNRDGIETVTIPQTLRVFTPGEGAVSGDPALLYRILEETAKSEEASKAAVKPLIEGQLKGAKEPLSPGRSGAEYLDGFGVGPEMVLPEAAPSSTALAAPEASEMTRTGTASAIAYRGVAPEQILRVQVPSESDPQGMLVTEYETQQRIFKYLAREIGRVTIDNYSAVGPTVGSFMVQARYGNHLFVVETPMQVARALKDGRLDEKRWLQAARVTLDGRAIQPVLE